MDSLSSNCLTRLYSMTGGSDDDPSFQPILQIINIKKIAASTSGPPRYRLILSDGTNHTQGLLATNLNHFIDNKSIEQHSIIRLQKFVVNFVQARELVVVLNCHAGTSNPGHRIGNPTDFSKRERAENAPPRRQQSQHQYQRQSTQGMYGSTQQGATAAAAGGMYHPVKRENTDTTALRNNTASYNPYGNNQNNNHHNSNPYSRTLAPIVRTTPNGTAVTPISNLNMYQSRWTIRARITVKSDIRTWSNARGEGSLFSITLLDNSGEIKGTFFKEAVDKFHPILEQGKVYTLSGGKMKVANQQYNTTKSNFEITFDQNSEIHLQDDAGDIRGNVFDFIPNIAAIEEVDPNRMIDVIAIIKSIGDPSTIMSKKTGNQLHKVDLTLIDDSGAEITMTLWGADKANSALQTYSDNPIVAFRRARVGDYGGRTLSLAGSAHIHPIADAPAEVKRLQEWWNSVGSKGSSTTKRLSSGRGFKSVAPFHERVPIASIRQQHLGHGDKPDLVTVKGTVTFIKRDKEGGAWYPACPNANDPCKNMFKVTQTTDGSWYCDKCNQSSDSPFRRWIFSGVVMDDTASGWVSFFNDQAEELLGGETTADQAYQRFMEHNQDQDGYDSLFFHATQTEWVLSCKVKSEVVNQKEKLKTSVLSILPMDYVKESEQIMAALATM